MSRSIVLLTTLIASTMSASVFHKEIEFSNDGGYYTVQWRMKNQQPQKMMYEPGTEFHLETGHHIKEEGQQNSKRTDHELLHDAGHQGGYHDVHQLENPTVNSVDLQTAHSDKHHDLDQDEGLMSGYLVTLQQKPTKLHQMDNVIADEAEHQGDLRHHVEKQKRHHEVVIQGVDNPVAYHLKEHLVEQHLSHHDLDESDDQEKSPLTETLRMMHHVRHNDIDGEKQHYVGEPQYEYPLIDAHQRRHLNQHQFGHQMGHHLETAMYEIHPVTDVHVISHSVHHQHKHHDLGEGEKEHHRSEEGHHPLVVRLMKHVHLDRHQVNNVKEEVDHLESHPLIDQAIGHQVDHQTGLGGEDEQHDLQVILHHLDHHSGHRDFAEEDKRNHRHHQPKYVVGVHDDEPLRRYLLEHQFGSQMGHHQEEDQIKYHLAYPEPVRHFRVHSGTQETLNGQNEHGMGETDQGMQHVVSHPHKGGRRRVSLHFGRKKHHTVHHH